MFSPERHGDDGLLGQLGRGVLLRDYPAFSQIKTTPDYKKFTRLSCRSSLLPVLPYAANGPLPMLAAQVAPGRTVWQGAYCMQALRCHGYLRIYPAHAGMKHVPTIVAVNTDPNASIFTIARDGTVADILDIQEAMASQMGQSR